MPQHLPTSQTQYEDMRGTCSIDWEPHPDQGLSALARAKGIDTEKYFPLAVEIAGMPPRYLTLYGAETGVAGSTAEELSAYAKTHGHLPVVVFRCETTPDELSKHMKLFSIAVTTRYVDVQQILVGEEFDLS